MIKRYFRVWLMVMVSLLLTGAAMAEPASGQAVETVKPAEAAKWRGLAIAALDEVKFDNAWAQRVLPDDPAEQVWLRQAFLVDHADLRSQMVFALTLSGDEAAVANQLGQIDKLVKQINHEDFQDELKWIRMFAAVGAGDDARAAREIAGMALIDDQAAAHASRAYILHQAGKKADAAKVIAEEVLPRLVRMQPELKEGEDMGWGYVSVMEQLLRIGDLANARRVYFMLDGVPEQVPAAIALGLYEKAAGHNEQANQLLGFADARLAQMKIPPGEIDGSEYNSALIISLAYQATRLALEDKAEEAQVLRARLKYAVYDILNGMWYEAWLRLEQKQTDEANRLGLFALKMIDEKLSGELTFERMYFGMELGILLVRSGYAQGNAETLQKMFADNADDPARQLLHAGLLVGIASEMTREATQAKP